MATVSRGGAPSPLAPHLGPPPLLPLRWAVPSPRRRKDTRCPPVPTLGCPGRADRTHRPPGRVCGSRARCGRAGAPGSGLARRSGARQWRWRRRRQEEQEEEEEEEEKGGAKGGAQPLRREPAGFAEPPPRAASRSARGNRQGAPPRPGCPGRAAPGAGEAAPGTGEAKRQLR